MAKKKDIEVRAEEIQRQENGQQVTVQQLFIGKKMIGEIIPEGTRFTVMIDGNREATVKSVDEGFEELIRYWNLHE
ncbi:hypothetical protein RU97_GL000305 [Enterococcus canis]|jgi:Protein of unknown function (DUF2969).|uniref:DUF2969 domain-containing protein n=1 Tax=Enterococcus canis TaxID=214095 RepID=A0A1L8RK47_9ENTE|nr:DUF2969 domain-containing protein [Enterococcus canis]OJG20072.1 hypothetical protein RU97_GL000305 [Enterococcus canis]